MGVFVCVFVCWYGCAAIISVTVCACVSLYLSGPGVGGEGVLGLPNDRGVPPINSKKDPFLGNKNRDKAPISKNLVT